MLKRIRYNTMNSWNRSTAPAYDMKIHHVIPQKWQNKVFKMLEADNFYDNINDLIREFGERFKHEWQAGFNGRSGGYLVLYRGGQKPSEYKRICYTCGQKNFQARSRVCGRCGSKSMRDYNGIDLFACPGKETLDEDVPAPVLKAFRKLAEAIIRDVMWNAKHTQVKQEEYQVTKHRKVLEEAGS